MLSRIFFQNKQQYQVGRCVSCICIYTSCCCLHVPPQFNFCKDLDPSAVGCRFGPWSPGSTPSSQSPKPETVVLACPSSSLLIQAGGGNPKHSCLSRSSLASMDCIGSSFRGASYLDRKLPQNLGLVVQALCGVLGLLCLEPWHAGLLS